VPFGAYLGVEAFASWLGELGFEFVALLQRIDRVVRFVPSGFDLVHQELNKQHNATSGISPTSPSSCSPTPPE